MQFCFSIKACAAFGALTVALGSAAPALAQEAALPADAYKASPAFAPDAELPGASYATSAVLAQAAPTLPPPGAPPAPGLPDMRPAWHGGAMPAAAPPVAELDSRTRDAWLRECRRRTDYYYDSGRRHWRRGHRDDAIRGGDYGYDYCEAYLDDYYRYYSQAGYGGFGYAHPGHGAMMGRRMMMAPARPAGPMASQRPCEEVVTEEYVPVRTRFVPRRAAPAKRLRDKRIRVY